MDYSKMGGAKQNGKEARFIDKTASGKQKAPGGRASRDEILAKLKATAEARTKDQA